MINHFDWEEYVMGTGWNFKKKTTTSACSNVSLKLNFKYKLDAQLSSLYPRHMFRGDTADFESECLIPNPIEKEGNDMKLLLDA